MHDEITLGQHNENAKWAAQLSDDQADFQRWLDDGADADDLPSSTSDEFIAMGYLPAVQYQLLGLIAAAGSMHPSGQRLVPRIAFAAALEPSQLQKLTALIKAIIAAVSDADDEGDGGIMAAGGRPGLRPLPRRRQRGYGMD